MGSFGGGGSLICSVLPRNFIGGESCPVSSKIVSSVIITRDK